MKIYTKRGDKGQTDAIGKRVSKGDLLIDIVGTLDEFSANLSYSKIGIENKDILTNIDVILNNVMMFSYELVGGKFELSEEEVTKIEESIDFFDSQLQPLRDFIKFDQNVNAARINISRTIIRRAERLIVLYNEDNVVNDNILKYVNRLSDFLFTVARILSEI